MSPRRAGAASVHDAADEECYLAYLPAAHILEFTASLCFFCFGSTIGFADPKTISSKVRATATLPPLCLFRSQRRPTKAPPTFRLVGGSYPSAFRPVSCGKPSRASDLTA